MVFCTNMTDTPLSDDILQLPNLRRFAVSTTHCLKYINTPGLQEFMLHGEYDHRGPPPGEIPHIVDFLRRAPCSLLRLTMRTLIPTVEVFQATPSLCELTVIGWNPERMTTLIRTLSPVERAPSKVLTHLTTISLGPVADLPDIAIETIAAHFNGADGYKRLQFFGILDTSKANAKVTRFRHTLPMQRLAEMQQAGLELCFVKGNKNYNAVLSSDPYSIRRCAKL
ncbi:hypothetical protein DFH06DRAFT_1196237 [Mycena polygramma]|nr:hypothetical protein DFH06DRAFT_1196237 [Mycena polygramma]